MDISFNDFVISVSTFKHSFNPCKLPLAGYRSAPMVCATWFLKMNSVITIILNFHRTMISISYLSQRTLQVTIHQMLYGRKKEKTYFSLSPVNANSKCPSSFVTAYTQWHITTLFSSYPRPQQHSHYKLHSCIGSVSHLKHEVLRQH